MWLDTQWRTPYSPILKKGLLVTQKECVHQATISIHEYLTYLTPEQTTEVRKEIVQFNKHLNLLKGFTDYFSFYSVEKQNHG